MKQCFAVCLAFIGSLLFVLFLETVFDSETDSKAGNSNATAKQITNDETFRLFAEKGSVAFEWQPGDATRYRLVVFPVPPDMVRLDGWGSDEVLGVTMMRGDRRGEVTFLYPEWGTHSSDINEENAHTRMIIAGLVNILFGPNEAQVWGVKILNSALEGHGREFKMQEGVENESA